MPLELRKGLSVSLPPQLGSLTDGVRPFLDQVGDVLDTFLKASSSIKTIACALEDVNIKWLTVKAAVSAIQTSLDDLGNSSELVAQSTHIVESVGIDQLVYNTFTAIDVKAEIEKLFESALPSHIDLSFFDNHDFWKFEIAHEISLLDIVVQVENAVLSLNLDSSTQAELDGLDLGNLVLKAVLDQEIEQLAAESLNAIDLKKNISQKIIAAGDTVDWGRQFGELVKSTDFKALYTQAAAAINVRERITQAVEDVTIRQSVSGATDNSVAAEKVANAIKEIELGRQIEDAINSVISSISWEERVTSVDVGSAVQSSIGFLPETPKITKPKISWITVHPYVEGIGTYSPVFKTYTLTPSQIYQAMCKKLDSLKEAYSPPSGSSAVSGGIIGIGVANSYQELASLVRSINDILDISELRNLPDLIEFHTKLPIEAPPEPLWQDTQLESLLPAYGEAKQQVQAYLNSVSQAATGSCEAVSFLINKLEKKLKTINKIMTLLDNLSAALEPEQPIMDFYWGYIPPTSGGVNKIKEALQTPPTVPDDSHKFCFGVLGVGQTTNIELFAKIFGL